MAVAKGIYIWIKEYAEICTKMKPNYRNGNKKGESLEEKVSVKTELKMLMSVETEVKI